MGDDPGLVNQIESVDRKHRVDFELLTNGMYRFVELTEDTGDEYTGTYMAFSYFSGLYDSAKSAEHDACHILPWLRANDPSNGS